MNSEKFLPKNPKLLNFFPFGLNSKNTRVKARSAPYLLRVRSMLVLGQAPSLVYMGPTWL